MALPTERDSNIFNKRSHLCIPEPHHYGNCVLADLVLYDQRAKLFCICAQLQLVGACSSSHVRGSTHGFSAFGVRFGTLGLGGTRIVNIYTCTVQRSCKQTAGFSYFFASAQDVGTI